MSIVLAVLAIHAGRPAAAAVLPEDRADQMYHYYTGGGVQVDGPALLVRKDIANKVSLAASYYADSVSGASIDVLTSASPYKDKRDEYQISADYLYRDSLMSLSYTNSKESDYLADTVGFNIAQEIFSGLTTISLGYTTGRDVVMRNTDASFRQSVDRYQYRLGLSQVITRDLVMSINYEAVADDGYLNNPYRSAIVLGAAVPERYPAARQSHSLALQARKGLDLFGREELRSALALGYRFYTDTWDIGAHSFEIGYQQYFTRQWLADWHYRYYTQSKAIFYSDNFPAEYIYMARDKELSTFSDHTLGMKLSYRLLDRWSFIDKATVSLAYDYLMFSYDDFTDVRTNDLYSFHASTIQLFVSFWY